MEQKGADIVSDIMRDFAEEIRKVSAREIALNLIEKGNNSLEDIADVTGLSLTEVEELAKKKTA